MRIHYYIHYYQYNSFIHQIGKIYWHESSNSLWVLSQPDRTDSDSDLKLPLSYPTRTSVLGVTTFEVSIRVPPPPCLSLTHVICCVLKRSTNVLWMILLYLQLPSAKMLPFMNKIGNKYWKPSGIMKALEAKGKSQSSHPFIHKISPMINQHQRVFRHWKQKTFSATFTMLCKLLSTYTLG